jgi:hypothetical protein
VSVRPSAFVILNKTHKIVVKFSSIKKFIFQKSSEIFK